MKLSALMGWFVCILFILGFTTNAEPVNDIQSDQTTVAQSSPDFTQLSMTTNVASGGNVSGGGFSLISSVAQYAAGGSPMTGGGFSVTGGILVPENVNSNAASHWTLFE